MKSVMPWCGVDLEDVPEDRPAADLDHGLGRTRRFLAEPRAETTGQNDRFHCASLRNQVVTERGALDGREQSSALSLQQV